MRVPLGKSGQDIIYKKAGNKNEDMLGMELTDFLQAILNRRSPEVTAESATEALRVALEIEKIGVGSVNA